MPVPTGSRLNHYEVVALLGEGGMGEVYRATDLKLQRQVALKVLPSDVAADPERRDRFRTEARAIAALNHPNIVTIYSVEESDGLDFLTMELVEGRTLTAVLAGGGRQSMDQFLAVALPLSDAVGAAHAAGITHRDLKPHNVMLGRENRLKVLDFGLAKRSAGALAASDAPTTLKTREGLVMGTVPYMSPEQIEGQVVDARSDIFSLGVIFYEMTTGRRPFSGDTDVALAAAISRDHPTPVTALAPWVPRALQDVIARCLTKRREARYQNGAELYRALQEIDNRTPSPSIDVVGPVSGLRAGAPPLVGRHAEHAETGGASARRGGWRRRTGAPGRRARRWQDSSGGGGARRRPPSTTCWW